MSGVFISYARDDRDKRFHALVSQLRKNRFEIWYDGEIPAGVSYASYIAEQLEASWAVVILWTPNSAKSDWVYEEAQRGRRKLVPVLLNRCTIPIGFGTLQTVDLSNWTGDENEREQLNPLFKRLNELRPFAEPTGRSQDEINEILAMPIARLTLYLGGYVSPENTLEDFSIDPQTVEGIELLSHFLEEASGDGDFPDSILEKLSSKSTLRQLFLTLAAD